MHGPSIATVKRLFAVSGNRCAFPECDVALVDPGSGKLTGRICHIQGRKGPRYNPEQSPEERHGYDNLLLLCPAHHDVVDADVHMYTAERLLEVKRAHESGAAKRLDLPDDVAATVVADFANAIEAGSVLASVNQSGGQVAHTITNIVQNGSGTVPAGAVASNTDTRRAGAIDDVWQHTLDALDATLDASVNLAPVPKTTRRRSHDALAGTPFPELADGAEFAEWESLQNDYLHIMAFPHFGQAATDAIDQLGRCVARARLFVPHEVSVAVRDIAARLGTMISMAGEAKTSIERWRAVMATARQAEQDVVTLEATLRRHIVSSDG